MNKPQKAIQAYQQMIVSSESLLCLGNAHFHDKNFEDAIQFYLRSIEFKEDPGTYNNLGVALKKVGLFQDSIFAFTDSLSMKPNAEAATNLLTLYIELGKKADAQQIFKVCGHLVAPTELKLLTKLYEENFPNRRTTIMSSKSPNLFIGLLRKGTLEGVDKKSPSPNMRRPTFKFNK